MTMMTVLLILAGVGAVWTGVLAAVFIGNPDRGLAMTTHHLPELPKVMADRYVAMTVMAVFSVLYRDPIVIAVLFATFSFMGFADAMIYQRAGKPIAKHLSAGFAALLVTVVALMSTNGAST